ncbi:MAG: molybdopterin-dependent oxidoreductase [Chloroflexi bacterium]|nr:molybdopterin-dependent oxidoreductase [Chloroflexota bacterium]
MSINRRSFLKLGGATAAGITALYMERQLAFLQSAPGIDNPLAHYPNRDWEKVYRDQYKYDSSFTFVCAPNCTHNCRLRAFVRNGVVLRTEQNYDGQKVGDLLGNKSTNAWNPRGCNKGATLTRRIYGPYRLKQPLMRAGWKKWAEDGFPGLDAANRTKYKFDSRGTDTFVKMKWDDTFKLVADGMVAIAKRYSGEEGKKILLAEGYQPEMVEEMGGAGTRTFKLRGGMGLLGVMGKYGMYRASNMMALLDVHTRGVKPEDARGGRNWSNYTWHGDQAPGTPFVTGLQNADCDFNDMRNAKLHIGVGKNLVENKMADAHFFIEMMERGGKIVTITPEYSPPATKADYWIPCRPGLGDTAIFLGISKLIMDRNLYDAAFVKGFTDFPLLVRTDTLKRLSAADMFPNYAPGLAKDGPSYKLQGLTDAQYTKLQDYVIYDAKTKAPKAVTREDVGARLAAKGFDPDLEFKGTVTLANGSQVEVMTLWQAYRQHLADYDLDTVAEISGSPKDLIERLANDIATIKPVAIHVGEGINHWFHATLHNRATHLPLMLTGNFGVPGAGCYSWAGNYKAALFQGTPETGPGFKGWIAEDPFAPNLNLAAKGKEIVAHAYTKDEEPAYWDHGDRALVVDTPKAGHKVFTGKSHMPTPTKVQWTTNVNLINNAKWVYGVLFNVLPKVDLIMTQDIEMTATCEYSDVVLPANSWLETEQPEVTASCQNPFLQIWKGGIKPIYDTKDDIAIMAGVAKALGDATGDKRFAEYWKFALEGRTDVYMQRLLDSSGTTSGYKVDEVLAGKYGEPGAALLMFRTYPRIPYWEQVHDNLPFHTDTGRMNSYCDIPEAIEYGENFIVHREGPEATPYLPNVIVSNNPLIRPNDYGIAREEMDPELRTVRNIKLPWAEVKKTKNKLWEDGYNFYFLTPKTRHTVHSSWGVTDWMVLWASNFADPYRTDKRLPGVGDQQLHMNPEDARAMQLADGDYVYVDANPADRPYIGWKASDPHYKVARLMLRVKYNPAYPRGVVMTKHGGFIATEKTVKAHETRPDGRATSEDTGYQSSFRYGSHQSVTKDWAMPMHQTDTLFHKAKVAQAFIFGGEADNHAVNTVPKETLVKITKAEAGGMEGQGAWVPGTTGMSPGGENTAMQSYLKGGFNTQKGG